jgi:hypothetical protein
MFYYSATDGHWRSAGGDHTSVDLLTQLACYIWNTCYFTDGTYSNYNDEGDKAGINSNLGRRMRRLTSLPMNVNWTCGDADRLSTPREGWDRRQ